MELDASAKGFGVIDCKGAAAIDGGLVVGGRFGANERLNELEKGWLLKACPGKQCAHGDGLIGGGIGWARRQAESSAQRVGPILEQFRNSRGFKAVPDAGRDPGIKSFGA